MKISMIDIIILKYNVKEAEDKCIKSVIKYTDVPYHLTVFDNYLYRHNIGKIWNRLINKSESDYICLLNSDTEVSQSWLSKLLETFEKIEKVGCVGPSTDNCINQQKNKAEEVFIDFSKMYPGWCLSGFCLIFPKKIWEEVNKFPEDFGFYGQEVSLIDKITALGYHQIWRTDVFVHHEKGVSIKRAQAAGGMNEEEERTKGRENYNKFRKKLHDN